MLKLTELSKTYDGFEFGPVDLSVGQEVLSVLGPSGSGKTTLLSLISGITPPDAGGILLNDTSLIGRSPEDRHTGLVFQDGALFPHMTVRENIAYSADQPAQVRELVDRFEITNVFEQYPQTLSGGEKQRVALARTIAANPDVLLLDEPLSSLDTPIRRRLRDELHDLFRSIEIPIIYVTHDQRAATALGDRIAVLHNGAIEQVGAPADVLKRPKTRFVARFSGSENIFNAQVIDQDEESVRLRVGDITLQSAAESTIGSTVTACIRPSHVQLHASDQGKKKPVENVLSGTVSRWLNEGDSYRVTIEVSDAPIELTAIVPPPLFKRLSIDSNPLVRTSIHPEAIHLIN